MRIDEIRSAYLYHGTSMLNLLSMYSQNRIMTSDQGERPRKHIISLSRSLKVAMAFTEPRGDPADGDGGVIVLDWNKLKQRYRVMPYNDFAFQSDDDRRYSEYEEIVDREINPLRPFVVSFLLPFDNVEDTLKNPQWLERQNIISRVVQQFLSDPLVKIIQ